MFSRKKAEAEAEFSAMPEKPFIADTPDWPAFWERKEKEFKKARKAFKLDDEQMHKVEIILEHLIADERWQKYSRHPFKPTFTEAMAVALLKNQNEFKLDDDKIVKMYPIEDKKFIDLTRNVTRIMIRHDAGYMPE